MLKIKITEFKFVIEKRELSHVKKKFTNTSSSGVAVFVGSHIKTRRKQNF
jgi:hypothetical protein